LSDLIRHGRKIALFVLFIVINATYGPSRHSLDKVIERRWQDGRDWPSFAAQRRGRWWSIQKCRGPPCRSPYRWISETAPPLN